ncbi:MAG: response regulator transcription factor [Oscillospiraceae bacterium]|nr:response regulator transcription factor [Oscillospiraceae bacterium]
MIYVVEDDGTIRELITATLQSAGYEMQAFEDGNALFSCADFAKAELYLLDIMLPDMDGYQILQKLKKSTDAPVIFLTAKGEEVDKATGLHLGADDYITKPFGVLEFLARVKAVMRRYEKTSSGKILEFGALKIDTDSKSVTVNGEKIKFSYKEFELLLYLAKNRNTVLSREQILSAVWGYDFEGETRTVDIHIKTIRQKIGDHAENPLYIETIRGYGYKFI